MYTWAVFFHLIIVAFWLGGMFFTSAVLVPATRKKLKSNRGLLFTELGTRFSRLSWFIKIGLIYLLLGLFLAISMELPYLNRGQLLMPVYWHMIAIGWITQVIMGLSIWMFPRNKRGRIKTETFASFAAFWSLNSGSICDGHRVLDFSALYEGRSERFINVGMEYGHSSQYRSMVNYCRLPFVFSEF